MKVKTMLKFILFLSVFAIQSDALNVLLVSPIPAFSHYYLGKKLMHALADHGHNVTIIAAFRDKELPKFCKEVYLEGLNDASEEEKKEMILKMGQTSRFLTPLMVFVFGEVVIRSALSNPEVRAFLNDSSQKFDVVVVEDFVDHAMKAFAYHFDAPLVAFSPLGPTEWVNKLVGNPAPWSYAPTLTISYPGRMNMWQRLANALVDFTTSAYEDIFYIPKMNNLIDEIFPGAPHVEELNKNVSVILLNSHVSTNQPLPLLPNVIEIGGFHVDPPKKLPDDLQKYLDSCKNGVIYFSMGSNLQSKYLPKETLDGIMKAFSKQKLDVLWKFEEDNLPGKPPSVKIVKWLPQQDILAHPNIKLFITHGGLLSTLETIYHGVPIIGIPTFGDQPANTDRAVNAGYAVKVDFFDLSEETLSAALDEALNNPKYAENAKRRSRIMLDRERSPKDTAVYWIEYAARHKGERHYRSAALDLAWYELYMVDAALFIVTVALLVLYLSFKAIKYLLCKRREKKVKKKLS